MFAKKIEHLADLLISYEVGQKKEKEWIVYGLTNIVHLLLNTVATIALGLLFGLVVESILFTIFFSYIRTYAGGYHCQTAGRCYFVSSGMIGLVLAIAKWTPQGYYGTITMVILVLSLPILIKLAPMETPNKPFDTAEWRYFRQKTRLHVAMECVLIGGLWLLKQTAIAYIIALGILTAAMLVCIGNQQMKKIKERNLR